MGVVLEVADVFGGMLAVWENAVHLLFMAGAGACFKKTVMLL
ncbi:hypothetical protein [Bartonella pachyuromydis]